MFSRSVWAVSYTHLVRMFYDKSDETEILIEILSFGTMIEVTGPDHFINIIKDRLLKQKSCDI